ncbi:MAG: sigma-70 family RNA polymerase sigma factor [Deltaproteobacteria bacterium]|nr:sigma-70 family RNA polymerase sigma factor [Deltaproteobacteria bacterium]
MTTTPGDKAQPTDADLLDAARGGDPRALEALIARHQSRIFRFGMRMCGDSEDAKDVLQDTLVAVTRTWNDFRGDSSVSTWLYSIARSFCLKRRRKEKQAADRVELLEQQGVDSPVHPGTGRQPDQLVRDAELRTALQDALLELDEKQREVFVLRDVEGLSARDVAESLGISVDAVKSRLHRARVTVRNRLAPVFFGDESRVPVSGSGCPDVLTLYSKNEEQEISADLCAEMERHLEGCESCRAACDSMKATLHLCRTSPVPEVPPEIQTQVRNALKTLMASPLGPSRAE